MGILSRTTSILLLFVFLSISVFAADSGIIRGQFKYPDKKVPKDLEVCAEEIHTNKFYCTKTFSKKKTGWSYAGQIPVGDYAVLARSHQAKAKTGYYTMHVHCEGADCKSHQRIVVHLYANQELDEIDPNDWALKEAKPGTDLRLDEFKIHAYRFRSLCDETFYTGYVSLFQEKEKVFHQEKCGHALSFEPQKIEFDEKSFRVPTIKDITGTATDNLVIASYSGGAHCCWSHTILSLTTPIEAILKTHDFNQDKPLENPGGVWESDSPIRFVDLRKTGVFNIIGLDETFDDWNGPYAVTSQVRPKVIFEFQNGQYVLATDLMKKSPPSADQFNEKVSEVSEKLGHTSELEEFQDKKWGEGGVPSELWGTMLHYIYAGNAELAWKFYDRVWSDDLAGKKEFLDEFKKQLEKSPYWPAIKAMTPEKKPEPEPKPKP